MNLPLFSLHVLSLFGRSLSRFAPCLCACVDVLFPVRCPGTAAFVPLSTEQFWRTPPRERQVVRSLNVCVCVCECEPLNRFLLRLSEHRTWHLHIALTQIYSVYDDVKQKIKPEKFIFYWCCVRLEVARSVGWIDMMLYNKRFGSLRGQTLFF